MHLPRLVVLSVLLVAACSGRDSGQRASDRESPGPTAPQVPPTPPPAQAAKIAAEQILISPKVEARNVRLHVTKNLALEVRRLRGTLVSTRPGLPPVFDDPRAFSIKIASAEIAVDGPSMSALMNDHVLAVPDAPLKDVEVKIEDGKMIVHATLSDTHLPVKMEGTPQAEPDGTVRMKTSKLEIEGVAAKTLSERLGLKAGKVIGLEPERGARLDGNDLLLDPSKAVPPPKISGKVREAHIEGDQLVLRFGRVEPPPRRIHGPNFFRFTGGRLVFGKLTMDATDMELDDADPKDIFDFSVPGQQKQLVAGWHKTTPANGLLVEMPDADDLARRTK